MCAIPRHCIITEFIRTWFKKISAFFLQLRQNPSFITPIRLQERKGERREGRRKRDWHIWYYYIVYFGAIFWDHVFINPVRYRNTEISTEIITSSRPVVSWLSLQDTHSSCTQWRIQGEGRGVRTPLSDLRGFLLSPLSIANWTTPKCTFQSLKSHFFPNTPSTPLLLTSTSNNSPSIYFTFSGKPWDPPYQNILDPPLVHVYTSIPLSVSWWQCWFQVESEQGLSHSSSQTWPFSASPFLFKVLIKRNVAYTHWCQVTASIEVCPLSRNLWRNEIWS